MSTLEKEIIYRGYKINVFYDEYPENPRADCDQLGTMMTWHPRYAFGDAMGDNAQDFVERDDETTALHLIKWTGAKEVQVNGWTYRRKDFLEDYWPKDLHDPAVVLPLYIYDHSGITMSTGPFSCPWDSGQVGYIFVTYRKLREVFGWKHITKRRIEKVKKHLKSEVEEYDHYLTGQVFYFQCHRPDHIGPDGSIVYEKYSFETCHGFYGPDHKSNGLLDNAQSAIDCEIEDQKKQYHQHINAVVLATTMDMPVTAEDGRLTTELFLKAYPEQEVIK